MCVPGVLGGQKGETESLQLELQMVVIHHVGARINSGSPGEQPMPVIAEPSPCYLKYRVIPPVPHTEDWRSHSNWQTPASLFSAVAEIGSLNADEVWRKKLSRQGSPMA